MNSCKRYAPVLVVALIAFLTASPALASFNGVLPVASLGTTPTAATVTLSSYALSAGQTATVTFTFPAAPSDFTGSDITASNGTISNLTVTADPKVYTATFTPTAQLSATTNTISVAPKVNVTQYTGVGATPENIAFDGTNMWTANTGGSVTKITPSGSMTTYTGVGLQPSAIAFDGTNMWTNNDDGTVSKITSSGTITMYSGLGTNLFNIAFDGTNMWATDYGGNSVVKISSSGSGTTYTGTGGNPWGIAFDGTNMWTANNTGGNVTKVTPTGTMTTYGGTSGVIGIAFDGTNMWTANSGDGTISKITPSGTVTSFVTSGGGPRNLAFDGTNMWATDFSSSPGKIYKITPSGSMTTYSSSGFVNAWGIAFDGTNMWVVNRGNSSVSKVVPMGGGVSSNYAINTVVVATPAVIVSHAHGMPALVMPTSTNGSLGFTIPSRVMTPIVPITLNADLNTTTGYAVSLDSTFANTGINPYRGTSATVTLPTASGTYTVYVEYFSKTGNHSVPVSHTVSLGSTSGTNIATSSATKKTFTQSLSLGSHGDAVAALQKLLVKDGELVLPANMTYGNFGILTKSALEAFQVKYNIAQKGDKGFGSFGPKSQTQANTLQ